MNQLKTLHSKQDGQMLVMAAISLVVVVGFAALAVDVGLWLHQRTKLQADADAMALAGAQLLCGSGTCQTQVEDLARAYGPKNSIENVEIEFVRTSGDCGGNPNPIGLQPNQYVAVEVKRTQPSFLAGVLGITNTKIRACAVAAKYGLGGTSGVRPFALEQKCIDGTVGPLITYGDLVTLKFDTEGKGTCQTSQGNFASLAIDGTGASIYETTIEKGSINPLCTDTTPGCCPTAGAPGCIGAYGVYKVDTETGNIISANRDGIQYLLDHTPTSCDTWDEIQVNGNITPDCAPWTPGYVGGTNTRILIVPIVTGLWDGGGNNTVTIKRFAVVFLDGWDTKNGKCTGSSCDIKARFIKSIVTLPNATLVPYTCSNGVCYDLSVAKIIQ